MDSAAIVPMIVVSLFSLGAAVTDVRSFRVPNALSIPLVLTGIGYHVIMGSWQSSLLGALFGFAGLFVFYLIGAMGAGDVKLMAGIGAWIGMPGTVYVFGIAGLATGVYSLLVLASAGRLGGVIVEFRLGLLRFWAVGRHFGAEDRVESLVKRQDRRRRLVPFSAMIAVAIGVLVIWTMGNLRGF